MTDYDGRMSDEPYEDGKPSCCEFHVTGGAPFLVCGRPEPEEESELERARR